MKFPFEPRIKFRTTFLIFAVIFSIANVRAQSNLESIVRDILYLDDAETYLQEYMQPFSTSFGTIVSGALYHRANVKEFPNFDIGISGHYLRIPASARSFVYMGEQQPTVFGDHSPGSAGIPGTGQGELLIPQIQLNMGLFSGFEFMLRGSNIQVTDIGEMNFRGFGVKYGLSDLLSVMFVPMDMSVQVLYHTFGIENWLNSGTFAMNVQISAQVIAPALAMFGGVGYESTSLKISTDKISGIGDAAIGDFSINGLNKIRVTLGSSLTFLFLNGHIEYNLGKYNSAAAGVMIAL